MATNFFQSAESDMGAMVDRFIFTAGSLWVVDRFGVPLLVEIMGPVESNGLKHLAMQTTAVVASETLLEKLKQHNMLSTIFGRVLKK